MSKSAANAATTAEEGLTIERRFTTAGIHPFDEVEWELRDAIIGDPENPAFEQRGVEFPKAWSQNATNIVAQKYFRGRVGSPERESSVKQMISRVAGTIAGWGRDGGYFASEEDGDAEDDAHFLRRNRAGEGEGEEHGDHHGSGGEAHHGDVADEARVDPNRVPQRDGAGDPGRNEAEHEVESEHDRCVGL